MTRSLARALFALAALALAACEQAPTAGGPSLVIATFYPLYEFSREVAGADAQVISLVPPGVEPHDWEPAPRDLARIRGARLLVYNGAGLEPWVPKLAGEVTAAGAQMVRATEGIPLAAEPGQPGGVDPHAWLDPVLAQSMLATIRGGLAAAFPSRAAAFADNERRYAARLRALDDAFRAGLAHCARRDVVTTHAALGYLARRYDLTVVPVSAFASVGEPSPAQLARVVRFARERKVQYIFFEPLGTPKLAETLAREIGARTLAFDPIEGLTPEQAAAGQTYLSLMEENLRHLRQGLACT